MSTPRSQRGFTIIEAMAAMAVMLIGAVGLMGLQSVGLRMNDDARHTMRAAAIAQDLINQMDTWDYTDARLSNANTGNDGDVGDTAFAYEANGTPPYDHAGATELDSTYTGIANADLVSGGYERYWNISDKDPADTSAAKLLDYNGNGIADGIRIAVIVRWPHQGAWRRIVLIGFKRNPAEAQ